MSEPVYRVGPHWPVARGQLEFCSVGAVFWAAAHLYALFFIVLGWVIFDFTDTSAMFQYLGSLFTWQNGLIGADAAYLALAYLPLFLVAVFACLPIGKQIYYRLEATRGGWVIDLGATVVILLLCTASLVSSTYNPFLYFRF